MTPSTILEQTIFEHMDQANHKLFLAQIKKHIISLVKQRLCSILNLFFNYIKV
jgi:hypothetical protein